MRAHLLPAASLLLLLLLLLLLGRRVNGRSPKDTIKLRARLARESRLGSGRILLGSVLGEVLAEETVVDAETGGTARGRKRRRHGVEIVETGSAGLLGEAGLDGGTAVAEIVV